MRCFPALSDNDAGTDVGECRRADEELEETAKDFVIKLFEIDLLQIKLLHLLEIVGYEDTFCFW